MGEEDGEECGERVEGAGESGVILGEEGGEGWRERMEEVWIGSQPPGSQGHLVLRIITYPNRLHPLNSTLILS